MDVPASEVSSEVPMETGDTSRSDERFTSTANLSQAERRQGLAESSASVSNQNPLQQYSLNGSHERESDEMVDLKNPAEQLEWLKDVIESRLREEVETAEGKQQDVAFAELKDAIKKASQCSVFVTIGIISDALRSLKGEIESQLFSEIVADQSHVMGEVLDQQQKLLVRQQLQQQQQQQQEMQQVQQRRMALQLQQQKQLEQQQQQQEMGKENSDPLPTQSQVPRDMPSVPTKKSDGHIWQGLLEWQDRSKASGDSFQIKQVHCFVSINNKDDNFDLKAEHWPPKLSMQLLPKQLISSIGNAHLKNSTSVLFSISPSESAESLTKVMTTGYAGCVYNQTCDLKVLILLYTPDKKVYLGFIPKDQTGFVDRLRSLIQARRNNTMRQGQNTAASQTGTPPNHMQGQAGPFGGRMRPPSMMTQINAPPNHIGGLMPNDMAPNQVGMMPNPNPPSMVHMGPNAVNIPQNNIGLRTNTAMMGEHLARQQNLVEMEQLRLQLQLNADRKDGHIWQGLLEWQDRSEATTDNIKQVQCFVSVNYKDNEFDLNAEHWPPNLSMQFLPKQLISSNANAFLRNSASVRFTISPSRSAESLTNVMTAGYGGYVHFNNSNDNQTCDLKGLILLYTRSMDTYLGYIPYDQSGFDNCLRSLIEAHENNPLRQVTQLYQY